MPLAKVGLARAYVLAGDKAACSSGYQDFFAVWKDADPDIPALREVKGGVRQAAVVAWLFDGGRASIIPIWIASKSVSA